MEVAVPFRGFSDAEFGDTAPSDLYPAALWFEEIHALLADLGNRLGGRVMGYRAVQGRDVRPGRDYFFDNLEIRRRGATGVPCFIGVYHVRKPADQVGSHLQAWRAAHDDTPRYSKPLAEVIAESRAAFHAGQLTQWLDTLAAELRQSIGL